MANNIKLKGFVMESGERYCLLVNSESGMPLYFPNLFVTTQVRNRSLSYASMEKVLVSIAVLLNYVAERKDNLESRFRTQQYLETHELDAIRDYAQKRLLSENRVVIKIQKSAKQYVASETTYTRVTYISLYIKWLAEYLIFDNAEKNTVQKINQMVKGLNARRPTKRGRNSGLIDKGLDEKKIETLQEVFKPNSNANPFRNISIQVRNDLMFSIMFYLGMRRGEVLNIRIRDIDFNNNQLVVIRNADEKDDTRTNEVNAKTLDRRLLLKDTLVKDISNYIINYRKFVSKPKQPDYLFVTHKNGPTKGLPLSISGFKKVIASAKKVSANINDFSAHRLRHHWNERFSREMDGKDKPLSEEQQEAARSDLMGWTQGSGTAASYNKRFIKYKAFEASLDLQESMVRLPKGMVK